MEEPKVPYLCPPLAVSLKDPTILEVCTFCGHSATVHHRCKSMARAELHLTSHIAEQSRERILRKNMRLTEEQR